MRPAHVRTYIVAALMLAMLTGCSSLTTLRPKVTMIDRPALGTVHEVELGDKLLAKGRRSEYDAMELSDVVEVGDGILTTKRTIPPQTLLAKSQNKNWTYYYASSISCWAVMTTYCEGGLKVNRADNSVMKVFTDMTVTSPTLQPTPAHRYVTVVAEKEPAFQQELIYNGRVDNYVKFVYRELINSTMRMPFTQEVQYDLNDSQTIGFKGARIEILEATNTKLKYKVISNFPGVGSEGFEWGTQ